MLARCRVALVLAVVATGSIWVLWLLRDEPPAVSEAVPPLVVGPAEGELSVVPEVSDVRESVISPPPRTEESRAPSRRDFKNPLVAPSFPDGGEVFSSNSDSETEVAIDKISLMLRDYRTIAGENPVGTNAEVMKAIMGGNPKGAMLGPPEGIVLNENSELIDRWGTPYFFHQLTKDLMEIQSAGPDRILWTSDDVVGR